MHKILLLLFGLQLLSCTIVNEEKVSFSDDDIKYTSFYTEATLDSGRRYHNPNLDIQIKLKKLRVLTTCGLNDLNWVELIQPEAFQLDVENSKKISLDCPLAPNDFDTTFVVEIPQKQKGLDSLIVFGMNTLVSDTVNETDIGEIVPESNRDWVALDTIYLLEGTQRLDSFKINSDSLAVKSLDEKYLQNKSQSIKMIVSEKRYEIDFKLWRYTCDESTYYECTEQGILWDTLMTKYSRVDTNTVDSVIIESIKTELFQICLNGSVICPIDQRKDSLVVSVTDSLYTEYEWHHFVAEKIKKCEHWNLAHFLNQDWFPSGAGQEANRNSSIKVTRELFVEEGCNEDIQDSIWTFYELEENKVVTGASVLSELNNLLSLP